MIRVDAYVSLRLAMKVCDSRLDLFLPIKNKSSSEGEELKQAENSKNDNGLSKSVSQQNSGSAQDQKCNSNKEQLCQEDKDTESSGQNILNMIMR